MKASASISSRNENFALATISKSMPPVNRTPFSDLMLHPDKLETAFKKARMENNAFEASRTFCRSAVNPSKQPVSHENSGAHQSSNHSQLKLKIMAFHLEAPFAESVKLAADFTGWEKFPLDMMKSEDGLWFITVPLPPGPCSYRFIVDGRWYDDPRQLCLPNLRGTTNAVLMVGMDAI
jgi:hypothetical protein